MCIDPAANVCSVCRLQISAKFGQGVDDLLETILLQAEVEELLSNPEKPAKGTVIEVL
jgi:translation initiation factor IF-2